MEKMNSPYKFDSISDAHRAFGLPKPLHPLISLINGANVPDSIHTPSGSHILGFYKISYKPRLSGRLKYGQHYYDFDEGGLLFASPNQLIGSNNDEENNAAECSLYTLLIHPDFLLGYPLSKKIKLYGFFSYAANEALHLSDAEKETMITLFKIIEAELSSRIDDFS